MAGEKTKPKPAAAAAKGNGVADLADGFVTTARAWTAQTSDPLVSAAFLLGWRVGLALGWAADGERTPWPDDDPGLDEEDRWSVLKRQIETSAAKLTGAPGPALPDSAPAPDDVPAIQAVRRDALSKLYVQDHFRGIAFALGGDLEAVCVAK